MKKALVSCCVAALIAAVHDAAPIAPSKQVASRTAFSKIAAVLSHERCANCHIAGDAPLQGRDGQPHSMRVRRGIDGRGTPAMRCSNCHQNESLPIEHTPPGAPDWRLPPALTPMAWRGLTAGEQCRMLTDPSKNGNRSLAQLLDHAAHDPLVLASWTPGPERGVPPMSHDAFVEAFTRWIELGAVCPE